MAVTAVLRRFCDMKKFSDMITVTVFFVMLSMFAVSLMFFQHKAEFEDEVRKNDNMPDTVSSFVRDNFPMSSNLKSIYANINVMFGKQQFGDIYIIGDKLIKSSKAVNRKRFEENIGQINDFANTTDVPIYVMAAPTAAGVYSSELPPTAVKNDQRELIDKLYMGLESNVGTIDAFYPMYSSKDEYVYYRTSDMWTPFGAYHAYAESVKKLGLKAETLQNYDQEYALSSYSGELYDRVMYSGITPDRINIFRSKYQSPITSVELFDGEKNAKSNSVYFKKALKTDNERNVFLQGDNYLRTTVKTSNENAPKLLIVKGSYANILAPFYTPHYSEITLIDPKLVNEKGGKLSDFVDISDYDQIMIMFDVVTFCQADYFDVLCS